MPPIRRSNLGRITRNANNQANYRSNQSTQERERIRYHKRVNFELEIQLIIAQT